MRRSLPKSFCSASRPPRPRPPWANDKARPRSPGADVLAGTDDQILLAAGADQVVVLDEPTDVSHAEIAIVVVGAIVVFGARIAHGHARLARNNLALLARRHRPTADAIDARSTRLNSSQ